MKGTSIWWIRQDLRLQDNPALTAAVQASKAIIPCFIFDPQDPYNWPKAEKRWTFLVNNLRALDSSLRSRGSRLVIRYGDPVQELARLVAETRAQVVFAEADFTPYGRERDRRVASSLPLQLVGGPTWQHPEALLNSNGKPYTIFTPFRRAWLRLALPSAEDLLPCPDHIATPESVTGTSLPELPELAEFPAGEKAAQKRLKNFLAGPVFSYAERRDRLDEDGTSRLSPYLRFGVVSPRQVIVAALEAMAEGPRRGPEAWLNELIWREFYVSILYHFPELLQRSFKSEFDAIAWSDDQRALEAWKKGQTGYPIVDAAMRQLTKTGWIHNRARMIVASFLVKDLLIDWRQGERWFMEHLVDGDPAANNGGWQWTAGVGTDATPYFRVFNPVIQAKKFDPEGQYIRRWVPELAHVPGQYVHEPWRMPPELQSHYGCIVGKDYPAPVIDHGEARQRALAAFRRVRHVARGSQAGAKR